MHRLYVSMENPMYWYMWEHVEWERLGQVGWVWPRR